VTAALGTLVQPHREGKILGKSNLDFEIAAYKAAMVENE
jgi:hypothetical protein